MQTISRVPGSRAEPEPGVSVVMEQGDMLPPAAPYGPEYQKAWLKLTLWRNPWPVSTELNQGNKLESLSFCRNKKHSHEQTHSPSFSFQPVPAFLKEVQAVRSETTFFKDLCVKHLLKKQEWRMALPATQMLFHFPSRCLHKTHTGLVQLGIRERKTIFHAQEASSQIKHPKEHAKCIFFNYSLLQFLTFGCMPCTIFCLVQSFVGCSCCIC